MPNDRFALPLAAGLGIEAMACREDGSSQIVTITDLSFDDCRIATSANYRIGERLRLHLEGQGWIQAEVKWASSGRAEMVFVTVPTA